jgi:beta-aspartyl-peptidase (threonine type)
MTGSASPLRRLRWPLLVASAVGVGFLVSLGVGRFARRLEAPVPTSTSILAVTQSRAFSPRVVLLVHGGAGTLRKADMTRDQEAAYRAAITQALQAGYAILHQGGPSLTAVVAAIHILEDSPLFNAGRGAVFTRAGANELDAAVMDGRTLKAGAVAGVRHIANPIELARLVMDKSPHVMLIGEGAEAFAREHGVPLVPKSYFFTEQRWKEYQEARDAERRGAAKGRVSATDLDPRREWKYGTVGAVALDAQGNLAAGTSTGGTSYKLPGRVGDSPIIGAGTYANNASCAVSATGQGEYFIRNVVAHDICARVAYQHASLDKAAQDVIEVELPRQGGEGGVIALDTAGRYTMRFNTEGMYRGVINAEGKVSVAIFGDSGAQR